MKVEKNHISVADVVDSGDSAMVGFVSDVLDCVPFAPTAEQMDLLVGFGHFMLYGGADSVMLVNGYAGTGKTSMIGAMVKALSSGGRKAVLLAPTGHAAKVFTEYAGRGALTIHRKIFRQDGYLAEGFSVAENKHRDTIFFVDEASMISNGGEGMVFGTGRLLDDLIHYVYGGVGCRLVLMGDVAQLPPVGQRSSPALDAEVLRSYGLRVCERRLTEIVRQATESGILFNATILRNVMGSGELRAPRLELQRFADIDAITGEFLLETISDCYDRDGMSETIVVTRSNKRASIFNRGIRNSILYREDELVSDDMLLVSKNNYFWAQDYEQIDFIANGDMMRVKRVWGEVEHRYGLNFANVTVEFPEYGDLEMDVKIILNCLGSDTPALTASQQEMLYREVMAELCGDKRTRYRALKQHPYFNALQVKYAYALTCHKAQGGQWKNVFVDMGAIMADAFTQLDFYRWLYTAITRARSQVWLINCPLPTDGALL